MGSNSSRPSRHDADHERLEAVQAQRARENEERRRTLNALHRRFLRALAEGGEAAHTVWQECRAELARHNLLAPDVVIMPSAWTPQPVPLPHPEPLPPTPTVLEAARVAADMLAARPPMTGADHIALGVYIRRLDLLYREVPYREEME